MLGRSGLGRTTLLLRQHQLRGGLGRRSVARARQHGGRRELEAGLTQNCVARLENVSKLAKQRAYTKSGTAIGRVSIL